MKRQATAAGFTIVEMMVVLAVTGGLFVAIAATLSGRQQSNEFTQAVQDVRSQIQQTITQVQSGFYTGQGDFMCMDNGSEAVITPSVGSQGLGTNHDCVFLGNVVQAKTDELVIYPIAGRRVATTLAESGATPIVTTDVNDAAIYTLKYGLTVAKMAYDDGAPSTTYAFGVLAPAGNDDSGATASNLALDIYGLPGVTKDDSSAITDITKVLRSQAGSPVKNPSGGVKICLESGSTNEYGLITVGQDNRQLNVALQTMQKAGNPNCGL